MTVYSQALFSSPVSRLAIMNTALAAFVLALPFLTAAERTAPRIGTVIPLSRRFNLADDNGVVNTTFIQRHKSSVQRKIQRGFAAFERNTGSVHPSNKAGLTKRATGADALTDDEGELWQGDISVGTPPVGFTGTVTVHFIRAL